MSPTLKDSGFGASDAGCRDGAVRLAARKRRCKDYASISARPEIARNAARRPDLPARRDRAPRQLLPVEVFGLLIVMCANWPRITDQARPGRRAHMR